VVNPVLKKKISRRRNEGLEVQQPFFNEKDGSIPYNIHNEFNLASCRDWASLRITIPSRKHVKSAKVSRAGVLAN
jgi:hypothetical protein